MRFSATTKKTYLDIFSSGVIPTFFFILIYCNKQINKKMRKEREILNEGFC